MKINKQRKRLIGIIFCLSIVLCVLIIWCILFQVGEQKTNELEITDTVLPSEVETTGPSNFVDVEMQEEYDTTADKQEPNDTENITIPEAGNETTQDPSEDANEKEMYENEQTEDMIESTQETSKPQGEEQSTTTPKEDEDDDEWELPR